MNSSICNNNNKKLFISKLIVLIADYIAIVLGTLAAYYLRLNLSILPVSSNFKVEEILRIWYCADRIFNYIIA